MPAPLVSVQAAGPLQYSEQEWERGWVTQGGEEVYAVRLRLAGALGDVVLHVADGGGEGGAPLLAPDDVTVTLVAGPAVGLSLEGGGAAAGGGPLRCGLRAVLHQVCVRSVDAAGNPAPPAAAVEVSWRACGWACMCVCVFQPEPCKLPVYAAYAQLRPTTTPSPPPPSPAGLPGQQRAGGGRQRRGGLGVGAGRQQGQAEQGGGGGVQGGPAGGGGARHLCAARAVGQPQGGGGRGQWAGAGVGAGGGLAVAWMGLPRGQRGRIDICLGQEGMGRTTPLQSFSGDAVVNKRMRAWVDACMTTAGAGLPRVPRPQVALQDGLVQVAMAPQNVVTGVGLVVPEDLGGGCQAGSAGGWVRWVAGGSRVGGWVGARRERCG